MSRNKLFFQVRISHVLRFISICGLFIVSSSSLRRGTTLPLPDITYLVTSEPVQVKAPISSLVGRDTGSYFLSRMVSTKNMAIENLPWLPLCDNVVPYN
jgi:hypothetical protein